MNFEQISPMNELCPMKDIVTRELRPLKKERMNTLKQIQTIMDIQESDEILSPFSNNQIISKPKKIQRFSIFTGGFDAIQTILDKEAEEQRITSMKENDHFLLLHRVKMKLLSKKYDKQHINPFHLNLLSDLSSGYTQNFKEKKNKEEDKPDLKSERTLTQQKYFSAKLYFMRASKFCHKFKLKIVVLLGKIPLIDGDSIPKIIWDFLITIVRLYFLIMIPLQVFPDSLLFYYINVTIGLTSALLVDQIMSFNTIFYELGQPVSKRSKITQYVINQDYGLQMVSILQLIIQIILQDTRDTWLQYLFILFFQQFKKIQYYINNLQNYMNLNKQQNSWIELFKLLFTIVYVIHCFGCSWFYVFIIYIITNQFGWKSQEIYRVSWLEKYNYLDSKQSKQYLISIYYSTTTMFTVGYGDITPQSDIEIILSMIFMITCSIMMSYIINTVGTVINEIQSFSESNRKNIQIINKYMQQKLIGYQLQYQIRQYLNYYVDSHWDEANEVNEIISKLSESLRERLQVESNQKILEQIPFFKNFSSNLMIPLVKSVKQMVVQPDNWIAFEHEDNNDQFLCFVEKGTVAMTTIPDKQNNHFMVIKKIEQSSTFGLENFIFGDQSIHAFRSVGFGRLLLLSRKQFIKALENNPRDLEIFSSLKDRYIQGRRQIEIVGLECLSCKSLEHQIQECPLLHYIPDRERIIKSHQYSREQNRNEINILRQKKRLIFKAVPDRQIIAELADIVHSIYPDYMQFYETKKTHDEDNQQITTIDTQVQPLQEIQSLSPIKIRTIGIKTKSIDIENKSQLSEFRKQKIENYNLEIQTPSTGSKLKMHATIIKKKIKSALFFYRLFRNSKQNLDSVNDLYNHDSTLSHKIYRIQKDEELVHYKGLLSRQDRIDCIKNFNDLQLNDFQLIKMKKILHGEIQIDQFERSMEFKNYYPQYNQEEVIYINNRSFTTNKTQTSRMSKLVKYLFYPGEFLNRKNAQKIKIERLNILRKNNVMSEDNKQLLIEQKEEKLKKFNGIVANRKQEVLENQKKQRNSNQRIFPLNNSIHQRRKSIARATWLQSNTGNDKSP